jgi:hypothetical protein
MLWWCKLNWIRAQLDPMAGSLFVMVVDSLDPDRRIFSTRATWPPRTLCSDGWAVVEHAAYEPCGCSGSYWRELWRLGRGTVIISDSSFAWCKATREGILDPRFDLWNVFHSDITSVGRIVYRWKYRNRPSRLLRYKEDEYIVYLEVRHEDVDCIDLPHGGDQWRGFMMLLWTVRLHRVKDRLNRLRLISGVERF